MTSSASRSRPPRLLFVSHHFPPDSSVGSKRSHRIAAQMLARGWQVDVLCAAQLYQDGYAPEMMAGLEGVNIVRTQEINPRAWGRWLRDRLRGGDGTDLAPRAAPATPSAQGAEAENTGNSRGSAALKRLLRSAQGEVRGLLSAVLNDWLEMPDQWAGWYPLAVRAAADLPRPDVVLATIPVSTAALVATRIAAQAGAPLVLDYRDPWYAAAHRPELPEARKRLETQLEALCHRRAAALVTVTPGLVKEIGEQNGREVHLIPNASEPERLAGIEAQVFDRPTLVYAGGIYGGRTISPILASLARLQASGELERHPLGLLVMGSNNEDVAREAARLGIERWVTVLGPQPHRAAMAAALGATANVLLVAPKHIRQVPAKVFEHIAAGRAMLALSPEGADVDRVLADHPAARCLRPEDGAGIDATLRDLATGRLVGEPGIPEPYTVKKTMDDLDDLLRAVAGRVASA